MEETTPPCPHLDPTITAAYLLMFSRQNLNPNDASDYRRRGKSLRPDYEFNPYGTIMGPYCNMDVHGNGDKATLNGNYIEVGQLLLKSVDEAHINEKNSDALTLTPNPNPKSGDEVHKNDKNYDEVGYTPPPPLGGLGFPLPLVVVIVV